MSVVHRPQDSSHRPPEAVDPPPPPLHWRARQWRDGDVMVALLVLWVASAVRVVGGALRREVFGTEATLAFVSFVLVPCVFFRARPRSSGDAKGARPGGPAVRPALRLVGKDPGGKRP
jgi:hypothetical protein